MTAPSALRSPQSIVHCPRRPVDSLNSWLQTDKRRCGLPRGRSPGTTSGHFGPDRNCNGDRVVLRWCSDVAYRASTPGTKPARLPARVPPPSTPGTRPGPARTCSWPDCASRSRCSQTRLRELGTPGAVRVDATARCEVRSTREAGDANCGSRKDRPRGIKAAHDAWSRHGASRQKRCRPRGRRRFLMDPCAPKQTSTPGAIHVHIGQLGSPCRADQCR